MNINELRDVMVSRLEALSLPEDIKAKKMKRIEKMCRLLERATATFSNTTYNNSPAVMIESNDERLMRRIASRLREISTLDNGMVYIY